MIEINQQQYNNLYTNNFIELKELNVDINLFEKQVFEIQHLFKNWGKKHLDIMFRKGIALVNDTGVIHNEIEPCIYPLDKWNEKYNVKYCDNDFTIPTEILELSCFNGLEIIKPYMIRSTILWWKKGSFFFPHKDTGIPTKSLRIWGTNKPEKYIFDFLDGTNYKNPIIKAGKLYLTDTSKMHYAEALDDDVYTFFIALDASAYNLLMNLKNV